MSTRPPIISAIAAAMPRNGTCSALMPATLSSSSIARCADEPGPPEPKVNSPGFCFAERDQLGERVHAEARAHQQHRGRIRDAADLHEVAHRIVGQLRIDRGRDRQRDVGEQQRVAVRLRAHDRLRAGGAARAAAVLDDDRLAELLGQFVGEQPRRDIGEGAGRERHDDADRPVRPVGLSEGASACHKGAKSCAKEQRASVHDGNPPFRHGRYQQIPPGTAALAAYLQCRNRGVMARLRRALVQALLAARAASSTSAILLAIVGFSGSLACASANFCRARLQVAAQQIRVADIVDHLRARPEDRERLAIGAVGKVVALEPVVGCGKPEPGFAVARQLFDGAAEMLFGEAVVLLAIVPLAERRGRRPDRRRAARP